MQDKRISRYTKVVRIMLIILLPLLLVLSTLSGDKNYGLLRCDIYDRGNGSVLSKV